MFRRLGLLLFMLLAVLLVARGASADQGAAHTLPVTVLALDTDDADEHADAFTGALRSRVRASQGWSLVDTSQSFGMITAALRCTGKPLTADCQQRIAEQLKADRYIYGYMQKGPQAGQVTAEIHLYQKGKPEAAHRETYSENLKDQNDETLRKLAQKALDHLGSSALGVIVVRAGSDDGEVVVDGEKRVGLQNGSARLELAPGSHSVEVVVNGPSAQKRNVLVSAGKETVVDWTLAPTPSEPPKPEKPFPLRKVIAISAMAVGVGMGVFAVERFLKYGELKDEFAANTQYAPEKFLKTDGPVDVCDARVASDGQTSASACELSKDAKAVSATGIVMAAGSGLFLAGGAILLLTDSSSTATPTSARGPRLTPTVGYGSGGMMLSGSF